jgi:hypothetical protein
MQNFVSLSQSDLSGIYVPDTWKITCKYPFLQNPKLRLSFGAPLVELVFALLLPSGIRGEYQFHYAFMAVKGCAKG